MALNWNWWKKNETPDRERKVLLLETLLAIHESIEDSEALLGYKGVTDLLRKVYWQVEEVMERHPELKDTEELMECWMDECLSMSMLVNGLMEEKEKLPVNL